MWSCARIWYYQGCRFCNLISIDLDRYPSGIIIFIMSLLYRMMLKFIKATNVQLGRSYYDSILIYNIFKLIIDTSMHMHTDMHENVWYAYGAITFNTTLVRGRKFGPRTKNVFFGPILTQSMAFIGPIIYKGLCPMRTPQKSMVYDLHISTTDNNSAKDILVMTSSLWLTNWL